MPRAGALLTVFVAHMAPQGSALRPLGYCLVRRRSSFLLVACAMAVKFLLQRLTLCSRLSCSCTPILFSYSHPNSYVEALTFNVTKLKDRALRLNQVMSGALIQEDWCPYKKCRSGRGHVQRGAHVRTHGKGSHLQAKERCFRRNYCCQCLDLVSKICENTFLVFKPPSQ